MGQGAREFLKSDEPERVAGPPIGIGSEHFREIQRQSDVCLYGAPGQECRLLEHEGGGFASARRDVPLDAPAGSLLEPRDDPQQRALPAP